MCTLQTQGGGRRSMYSQEGMLYLQGFYCRAVTAVSHPPTELQRKRSRRRQFHCLHCVCYPHSRGPQVNVLEQVEGEKAARSTATTPAGKKKRTDESPQPSKKKTSSKPRSDDLKILDVKYCYLTSLLLYQWSW